VARMTDEQRKKREEFQSAVLGELARLAGTQLADDQIARRGTELVLPQDMEPQEAIPFLEEYVERMESSTDFERTYQYRPFDGAVALNRALLRVFGTTGIPQSQWSFFGRQRPQLVTINVDVDETTQVPWGLLEVPMINGRMLVSQSMSPTFGPLFSLTVTAPRKYRAAIEGLFAVVEEELKRESIYRGKAVDGQPTPEFVDLSTVDPAEVIYSDDTQAQLEANIWSTLRYTAVHRKAGLPRKRAVLLEGPYGTGKTLAAFLTAQIAVENGWTFLYCRPAQDDLFTVMATARLYQPAVVFFEDVDAIAQDGDADAVGQLLDVFDGIKAKGTEILAVLTTNHKERIHRAMIRPGRLDAVVHIGALDQGGIERMTRATVAAENLGDDLDFEPIAGAMDGFLPAFVREAIDRAKRYSIARNDGELGTLATEDFVLAAEGLRPQLDLMGEAGEGIKPDALGVALTRQVRAAIDQVGIHDESGALGGGHVLTITPNGS
jgi:transitional endoplasmic reticulum ATPase